MPQKPTLPPAVLLFLKVMVAVFLAEGLVMFILYRLPPFGDGLDALVDSTILALLLTPLFWRWLVASERQRRRAEEGLHLQSAAFTAAANAIVITNRDGTIVSANPAFAALSGYTLAEVVGENLRDLVKSGRHERAFYDKLWQTICAGRVWQGVIVNRRKDGSHYSEEQTITPVRDAAGVITHFIAIKLDLTERMQAEDERQRLGDLVEASLNEIYTFDAQTLRFEYVNAAGRHNVGYEMNEMRKLTPLDLAPELTPASFEELIGPLRRHEKNKIVFETVHRRAFGSCYPVEVNLQLFDRGAGSVFLAIVNDVTERNRVEEAIRHSEERYRLLFENSPLAMWLYDADTLQFLAVNESAVRQYGYTREEFCRMTIDQIRPPEAIPVLRKLLAEGSDADRRTGEHRHRRKDGTDIYVETISRPLVFEGRSVRLVLSNDVTSKKQLEEELLHLQRLENLGMIAAGVAHDLNNVLAPIVFAAPLLRKALTDARDVTILDILEASARRGAGLVKQILGFAHAATGEFRPTQVKHVLHEIVSLVEETFSKSIQLEHKIPSDLWPVEGNPTQIHQVLLNLCINARDAMPQGGTLRIVAANRRLDVEEARALPGATPGAWIAIEVTDTGTGIAPEVIDRIWEPFFTLKGAKRGTGLGLSTVRGIVLNHHGFVGLDSALGRGTTVRIFLPAVESDATVGHDAPSSDLPRGRGELILLVEDDAAIRDSVAALLQHYGYRVESCGDGMEAIAAFTASPVIPALVITDVDMPKLGGVELARALRQLHPDLRLLAMSGLSHNEPGSADVQAARELAQAFLAKPFKAEDLLRTVQGLLRPP